MNEETNNSKALTPKEIEAIQKAFDFLANIIKPLVEAVKSLIEFFNSVWEGFMKEVSNPRVYHLALHAKTQRARKKNRRRMMLEFERYLKGVRNEKKMLSMPKEV